MRECGGLAGDWGRDCCTTLPNVRIRRQMMLGGPERRNVRCRREVRCSLKLSQCEVLGCSSVVISDTRNKIAMQASKQGRAAKSYSPVSFLLSIWKQPPTRGRHQSHFVVCWSSRPAPSLQTSACSLFWHKH